ncbi:MAG: M20 family metallopeptidase [Endomicrobiaceae bacterium]|nr:M20 family metallopeptidase [Endomicrobiaceae bacterium]
MNLSEELKNIRRTIHQNPELGNEEFKTSALVEKFLKKHKVKTYRLCKTGIVGVLEGTKKSSTKQKTIALRADLDALPICEKNKVPYKSKNNGVMHACGHDGNTAIVLGTAMLLAEQRDQFSGKVQFIFQPNEEASGGARRMIEEGVLAKNKVDTILGVHVNPWIKTGKIGLKYGAMMAGVDKFIVEIEGLTGHGAYPHFSKDAIVCASQFVMSLQTIVSRVISPLEPVVVSVGEISGGERYNIICGKVKLVGTVRTLNNKIRTKIKQEIIKRLDGVSKMYDTKYTLDYKTLGLPLINADSIVDICEKSAIEHYGKNNVCLLKEPSMGGEDFAEYLQKIKGCFIYIGTSSNKQTSYPWHHENFDIDEKSLATGAQYIAYTAKKILNNCKI